MATENAAFVEKMAGHTIRFEPPDIFWAEMVGDVTPDEMVWIGRTFARASERFYIIVNTNQLKSVGAGAKKALKEIPFASGIAFVGASRQMQFALSLMNKIYMMLNFGKNSPVSFVATEEEARSWIEHLRATAKK